MCSWRIRAAKTTDDWEADLISSRTESRHGGNWAGSFFDLASVPQPAFDRVSQTLAIAIGSLGRPAGRDWAEAKIGLNRNETV